MDSVSPVSYTHLDVYKRQLLEIERTAQGRVETMLPHMMETAGVTEELKACDPMRWVGLMNTLTAVSYTHLDVYKRQDILFHQGNPLFSIRCGLYGGFHRFVKLSYFCFKLLLLCLLYTSNARNNMVFPDPFLPQNPYIFPVSISRLMSLSIVLPFIFL